LVAWQWVAAPPTICVVFSTWRPISLIEADSSSAAAATVCTFVEASSDAAAALVACSSVLLATSVEGAGSVKHGLGVADTALTTASTSTLEIGNQLVDLLLAGAALFGGFGAFAFQAFAFDHCIAEHGHGLGHIADFIGALGPSSATVVLPSASSPISPTKTY
jgi:hypothetical protein